jgi:hypothetical protein
MRRIITGEACTPCGQLVKMGSPDIPGSVTSDIIVSNFIGKNMDDVGLNP